MPPKIKRNLAGELHAPKQSNVHELKLPPKVLAMRIFSEILGESIWVTKDDTPPPDDGLVVYTESEIQKLSKIKLDDQYLKHLHVMKKTIPCTVIEARNT